MINTVQKAVEVYRHKWDELGKQPGSPLAFTNLVPTSVGWKVADVAEFDRTVTALRDQCSHVLHGWLNNRWIAKMVLRQPVAWDIRIIKVMQIRPGCNDALGLDHVDFYTQKSPDQLKGLLKDTPIKWTAETNHPDFTWVSLWFAGTEAKLKNYTVLDIYNTDLSEVSARIKKGPAA